jgi:hypothetical protein
MAIQKSQGEHEEVGWSKDYWAWIAFIVVILVIALIRFNLLDVLLERDEGEYAYAGQLILKGFPPYKLAYNMKFPGIYAAYALVLAVFGETHTGVHLALLLMNAATAIMLFLLGRRLFDPLTGMAAGAGFAVLSISQSVHGLQANAEHFVILFVTAGLLLLIGAIESKKNLGLFLSGLLMGGGILMKQHGAAFAIFSGLYLATILAIKRRGGLYTPISKLLLFCTGVLLPFGITCIILYSAGVFDKFWFWTIDYARVYANPMPIPLALRFFKHYSAPILNASWPLLALAAIGVTAMAWDKQARSKRLFLVGFLVFSIIAVLPGLYFRPHYFLLALPSAAIFFGLGVASITRLFSKLNSTPIKASIATALIGFALIYPVYLQRDTLFFSSPKKISRSTYGFNPFPEALEIAHYIKEHSSEDDRIAILGSEPEIYFYSDRLSATGYIYTYALMKSHRYALNMQKEMIREIETAKPLYLVFVNLRNSWDMRSNAKKLIFNWLDSYIPMHYEVEGVVDIISKEETRYIWGEDSKEYAPLSKRWLAIYRRKEDL